MQPEISARGSSVLHPVRRVRGYLGTIRQLLGQTRDQVHDTRTELAAHLSELEALVSSQLAQLERLVAAAEVSGSSRETQHAQLVEILRWIHDDRHGRRSRLRELRAGEAYERAYADPDPLVSVVIPTYDNHRLLRDRAIPSVLGQTYQNFEIIIAGDAASEEARAAVESFRDPRITFFNRPYRGPYPADPAVRWLVAGVPPYNEAVARARGAWIAPLDDDDAFRPSHIERVLSTAREARLELCYGRLRAHLSDGSTTRIGRFPPEEGSFGLQSAVYHAGLAGIFELELADAAFGIPYDWALCQRMMEADVRIGMVEEETVDYYPSRHWTPRWDDDPAKPGEDLSEWEFVPEGFARAHRAGERAATGWGAEDVANAYRAKWPQFLEAIDEFRELTAGW